MTPLFYLMTMPNCGFLVGCLLNSLTVSPFVHNCEPKVTLPVAREFRGNKVRTRFGERGTRLLLCKFLIGLNEYSFAQTQSPIQEAMTPPPPQLWHNERNVRHAFSYPWLEGPNSRINVTYQSEMKIADTFSTSFLPACTVSHNSAYDTPSNMDFSPCTHFSHFPSITVNNVG
jgi:hypothetical protein